MFADASTKAYGVVAYLCEGQQSSLVMSRTRVAPLKTKTLPRLELMAAVIGARLAQFVKSSLTPLCTDISTFLWSESQIVLHWLNSHKTLKQFITSRVQKITESFPPTMWNYCPTADNPADLLTRGISATALKESTLWRHGPAWLKTNEWPVWDHTEVLHLQTGTTNSEEEEDTANSTHTPKAFGAHKIISLTDHSSLNKLLAVTAYVLQFIRNTKQPNSRSIGPLTPQELSKATLTWIQNYQQQSFART